MTTETWGSIAGIACVVTIIAFAVIVVIAVHVISKFPDEADPRRDEPKYTRPAAWALLVAFIGALVTVVSFIAFIATSLR